MQISSSQAIAGCPILEVRKFIRRYRDTSFSTATAKNSLTLSSKSTVQLLGELAKLKFIQESSQSDKDQFYEVTNLGQMPSERVRCQAHL